jgi:hypothetical protein
MTDGQRRTLAREETANTLSMGVWFENTLNQGLLREEWIDQAQRDQMREFFEEQGLLNGFSRRVWRRYGFIA